jgi:prepilin-type processing-associated H-X9-DG protein
MRRRDQSPRRGISLIDVVIASLVVSLIVLLALPALEMAREKARRWQCTANLGRLGTALQSYHDAHGSLPPAAVWRPGRFRSLALHESKRIDLVTYQNWLQLLLPSLGRDDLARQFDRAYPIGAPENLAARTAPFSGANCPSDDFNRSDNLYAFSLASADDPVEFARGNYAINGGTHNHRFDPESAAIPFGDGMDLVIDDAARNFQMIGSGIAGINQSFSLNDFSNGRSTLVAVEEVRAGIHPLDPRGVWALGQIGGSITWGHGINSDACNPNNQWPRADDVLGCKALHEAVGSEILRTERMPCVDYVDRNQQATARSLHEGGVNILFLDGAVRFVGDGVDRGLWHVMHSRETPRDVLRDDFVSHLEARLPASEAPQPARPAATAADGPSKELTNSIGMAFVQIPAGEFEMGIPDRGNSGSPPPECPAHPVRITRPVWMGRHEVTRHAFRTVMGSDPSQSDTTVEPAEAADDSDRMPVDFVTWHEAVDFCRKLSDQPAERAAGRKYRLPTEAEWEYACRAGSDKPYEWHQQRQAGDESGENSGILPSLPLKPVGSYPPNAFGLYDMRGNVWEWCADWFDRSYYSRSPVNDPQGPATGYIKVVRGGDWIFVGEPCLINYTVMPPARANRFIGFRVVCEFGRSQTD